MVLSTPQGIGQRPTRSYSWQNQSLLGVVHRFVRHVDATTNASPPSTSTSPISLSAKPTLSSSSPPPPRPLYLLAMPRFTQRTPHSDSIEWAALLLLILIFSPYLFGYFNVWLL